MFQKDLVVVVHEYFMANIPVCHLLTFVHLIAFKGNRVFIVLSSSNSHCAVFLVKGVFVCTCFQFTFIYTPNVIVTTTFSIFFWTSYVSSCNNHDTSLVILRSRVFFNMATSINSQKRSNAVK